LPFGRNDLTPALIHHATLPLVSEREGLTAALTAFGDACYAIDDDPKLPLA
jgi:hypothetical protein